MLAPAGKIIRGGALGMLKETLVGGSTRPARHRRQTQSRESSAYQSYHFITIPAIVEKIIDLSSFDSEEDTIAGIAPEYITRDRVSFEF